jgi:hypothetical protein
METELDLAYLAGFFDGEGSISILKRKKGEWNVSHFLRVSVGQKDGATLDWIKEKFGGNVYLVSRDGSYLWAVTDKNAYVFLKKIQSYLQYKKPQADLGIRFYEERILGATRRNRKIPLSEEELALRESAYEEMKALKKTFIPSVNVRRFND